MSGEPDVPVKHICTVNGCGRETNNITRICNECYELFRRAREAYWDEESRYKKSFHNPHKRFDDRFREGMDNLRNGK